MITDKYSRGWGFEKVCYILSGQPQYRNIIGAKVFGIGEHPISEVLTKAHPLLSADNEYEYLANAGLILQFPAIRKSGILF